jgi:hypothetical protein
MTNPFGGGRSYLTVVFVVGIALGAWAMRVYFDHTLKTWDPAERLTVQLAEDLHLSVDQKRQVAVILTAQKRRMEDTRDKWRSDVRLLARDGEDQIARVLRADQMDAFMHLHDRIHGRMDRFLWTSDSAPTAIAAAPVLP